MYVVLTMMYLSHQYVGPSKSGDHGGYGDYVGTIHFIYYISIISKSGDHHNGPHFSNVYIYIYILSKSGDHHIGPHFSNIYIYTA